MHSYASLLQSKFNFLQKVHQNYLFKGEAYHFQHGCSTTQFPPELHSLSLYPPLTRIHVRNQKIL